MNAIALTNIRKSFGAVNALDGVTLGIKAGEFYGLLGPNGAGKTTLLRILCGLLTADAGEIMVAGNGNASNNRPLIGVVPQEIALYEMLTARENLHIFGKVLGLDGAELRERMQWTLACVGLEDRAGSKIKTFSGGMMRRLNLAVGLLADPPILLLDEPTVGVDPQSRTKIFDVLTELHRAGKTLIYTTHYMEEAERLCQRIGIMDHGHVLAEGTLTELLEMVKLPRVVRIHGLFDESSAPIFNNAERVLDEDHVDYVPRRPEDIPALLQRLAGSGLAYERLEVTGATLETLFLQLTGTELRN